MSDVHHTRNTQEYSRGIFRSRLCTHGHTHSTGGKSAFALREREPVRERERERRRRRGAIPKEGGEANARTAQVWRNWTIFIFIKAVRKFGSESTTDEHTRQVRRNEFGGRNPSKEEQISVSLSLLIECICMGNQNKRATRGRVNHGARIIT